MLILSLGSNMAIIGYRRFMVARSLASVCWVSFQGDGNAVVAGSCYKYMMPYRKFPIVQYCL